MGLRPGELLALERAATKWLAEIYALIDRLRSGLTSEDRGQSWGDETAEAWAEILSETRAELLRATVNPRELWIVTGAARQLDFDGTTKAILRTRCSQSPMASVDQ